MSQIDRQNQVNILYTKRSTSHRTPLRELSPRNLRVCSSSIDLKYAEDPLYIGTYAPIISRYLLDLESSFLCRANYMSNQQHITPKMRSVLVDWLVSVHRKFRLRPETLYLTVHIIDRYLSASQIQTIALQLLGVSSMLIACKYEEIYSPQINDFVFITDNAYSRKQIIDKETEILNKLDFRITAPTALVFFMRFKLLMEFNPKEESLGLYLLELSLLGIQMLGFRPSMIAASVVSLVVKIYRKAAWTLQAHCGYSETQLKTCSKELVVLMQGDKSSLLRSVRTKYSKPEYFQVALTKI